MTQHPDAGTTVIGTGQTVPTFRGRNIVKVPAGYPCAGRNAYITDIGADTVTVFVPAKRNVAVRQAHKSSAIEIKIADLGS
jgi:hypothetical protein